MEHRDIYKAVSDRIIAALEAGDVAPWQRPWKLSGGFPVNIKNGRHYRGVNVLLLMLEGYDDPRWGTYKAIQGAGGQVRKGEHHTQIVFWKRVERKNPKEGEDRAYRMLRTYQVFNAKQVDGLPDLPVEVEREFTPIQEAERIVNGYVWTSGSKINGGLAVDRINQGLGPMVKIGYDRAAYSLREDSIEMPRPQQFVSDEAYYTTLFHELVHSTGAEKRLKRIETALFGSDPYAREELVAEIGASFLGGIAGFESAVGDESAAYVSGWLEKIKQDPKLVVQAAAQAQKAADLILGTTFEEPPVETELPDPVLALAPSV